MTEMPTGLLGTLTAVAATIGAFIAVGRAASEAIRGHYMARTEQERSKQQLQIEKIRSESDLAKDYLAIIFKAETTQVDRVALLSALSTLNAHPLQQWAQEQYDEARENLNELSEARERQLAAARADTVDEIGIVSARIEVNSKKFNLVRDDQEKAEKVYATLLKDSQRLGLLEAEKAKLASSLKEYLSGSSESVGERWAKVQDDLTAGNLSSAFPATPEANIEQNLSGIIAALQEFDLLDPRLVAVTLSLIGSRSTSFLPVEESVARTNTSPGGNPFDLYDDRSDLGNQGPPDGELFKGRGYIRLTGRDNYRKFGKRINLPLETNPDLAQDPQISARILASYVDGKRDKIMSYLEHNDLRAVRGLFDEASHGLETFREKYRMIMTLVNEPKNAVQSR